MANQDRLIPIAGLDGLSRTYQKATQASPKGPMLSVSGNYLGLVYLIVSLLLAAPLQKAVVVVDVEARFQVRRLLEFSSFLPVGGDGEAATAKDGSDTVTITKDDVEHLYLYRPSREQLKDTVSGVEDFMLYGKHNSRDRAWWGTIVIGGSGAEGDVSCGWKGWLRIERDEVKHFGHISADEALPMRKERQERIDGSGLWGRSHVGDVKIL